MTFGDALATRLTGVFAAWAILVGAFLLLS